MIEGLPTYVSPFFIATRPMLTAWNVLALVLLANIVATAVLAFASPLQKIAFDQPNRAITYFPFVWLPAVVVPVVFFSHLTTLYQLLANRYKQSGF